MNVAAYPKYEKYVSKDWIGNSGLPSHWQVKALKHGAHIVLGKMLCPVNKGRYHLKPYLKSKNIQWLSVNVTNVDEMWFSPQEVKQYKLVKGDLVLSEGGEVGKACIWDDELEECYIQNSAHKVTMQRGNVPRFFLYQMYAFGMYGSFDAAVNRVSIAHLTYEKLSNIEFAFPSLPEQRAIAAFLDGKCAAIDEAVRIKEAQIKLLREHRQILIQQAVTRGLNPDAPMKNSGIDWIGQIPAHWEVKRNKHMFVEINERSARGEEQHLSMSQKLGLVPANLVEKSLASESYQGAKLVQKGDLVLNRLKAHLAVFSLAPMGGLVSPDYSVFRPFVPGVSNDYFEILFKTSKYLGEFRLRVRGIVEGFYRLYTDDFMDCPLLLPPPDEQASIVQHVRAVCEKFDNAISIKQDQIATLKEYKTILINAAVTGKIKVA